MYPEKETSLSYEYLQKVVSALEEPICLIGGWAIYLTVNKAYNASTGKDYIGSRDIDLGFHIEEKQELKNTTFGKAMKKLEEEGFTEVGGRMVKNLDYDTGEEVEPKEAKEKPMYELHKMYVDLMVDHAPKPDNLKETNLIFDEELLQYVFDDPTHREELEQFNKKLWMPKPWLLLAMKTKSLPNRQKDHKRQKDIADIAAITLFTKQEDTPYNLIEVLRKDKILQSLKSITPDEIAGTESLLGVQPNSFRAALSDLITKIDRTYKAKVKKILSDGKRVQVARNHSVGEINNTIPGLQLGEYVFCNDFETIRRMRIDKNNA